MTALGDKALSCEVAVLSNSKQLFKALDCRPLEFDYLPTAFRDLNIPISDLWLPFKTRMLLVCSTKGYNGR